VPARQVPDHYHYHDHDLVLVLDHAVEHAAIGHDHHDDDHHVELPPELMHATLTPAVSRW
jgi:hypothetical protein